MNRGPYLETTLSLINTRANEQLLRTVPHRSFLDLSIVYREVVALGDGKSASILISNKDAQAMNKTEEELFRDAYNETRSVLPFCVERLSSAVENVALHIKDCDISKEVESLLGDFAPSFFHFPMWVAHAKNRNWGACCVLYPDILENITDAVGMDCFLLPSSVHEMLVVPALEAHLNSLANTVRVENTAVSKCERLSNSVYRLDACSGNLSIAKLGELE